jgi:GntR family transcriptional regulator
MKGLMGTNIKLYFQIVTTSGVPIYRQIQDQVKTLIATGRFAKDEFMPSVRQMANELEINPMTVSKAYSLLEAEGVLEYVRGKGMRICSSVAPRADLDEREAAIAPLLKEVISRAAQLSLSQTHFQQLVDKIWEKDNE